MGEILGALAAQHAELDDVLAVVDDDGWQRPTPCEGWTVADVVLHLAQTDELAVASVAGRFDDVARELTGGPGVAASIDEGAARMVDRARGAAGAAVGEGWRSGAEALRLALAGCEPHRRLRWVAGELSVRTLATTRLAEGWIHTGDVAAAVGRQVVPTDRLRHIARLAWRTLPYAFARAGRELAGPVAFELRSPAGDRWDLRPDTEPRTTIRGDALDLCLVAGRRVDPARTSLRGTGPDADAVLELVRTYA